MSNYFDRYKARVKRALNCKDTLMKDAEYRFNQVMDEALTTHECKYTKVGEFPDLEKNGTIKININDVTNNDKSAYDEKKVLVSKDADMDVGSYVWFNDCWWIAVFKEHQSLNLYKKLIMKVCNQIVKYQFNGVVYDIPVNIHNMTLYSDGMADQRYMSYGDSKCRFVIGKNPITEKIDVGARFIINHDVPYRVTNKVDYEYNGYTSGNDAIMNFILLQVPRSPYDDVEENVAYNKFGKYVDELFVGNDICYIGEENEYVFRTKQMISYELESDTDKITISVENNICTLHCEYDLSLIGKTVNIIVNDDEGEFLINKKVLIKGV